MIQNDNNNCPCRCPSRENTKQNRRENFKLFFNAITTLCTLVLTGLIAYYTVTLYKMQISAQEPLFIISKENDYNANIDSVTSESLIISNESGPIKYSSTSIRSFLFIEYFKNNNTITNYYIPIYNFAYSVEYNNPKGKIHKAVGKNNIEKFSGLLKNTRNKLNIVFMDIVSFTTINYVSITGENKVVYFKDIYEIDKLPNFIKLMDGKKMFNIDEIEFQSESEFEQQFKIYKELN
ncbi:MAG: hypothetical protein F8N36_07740 [Desulfovibrio sp.]|uniref:hypothetical protein n=1 Tax=Desulfovibrio sp. TaxID=885 RepID=UPI00135DD71B|nr:hypothetical protein [Desulfovibrio sp.]MTJ92738.1 hypothetical protein [Desulfovibrio sp.]